MASMDIQDNFSVNAGDDNNNSVNDDPNSIPQDDGPRDASLGLKESEVRSEYVCPSLVQNQGVVIQFINQGCPNTATIIGGMRLEITEIEKVPRYLSLYKGFIRKQAALHLHRHFVDARSPIGAGEAVCDNDFSLSYSVASLSPRGSLLHPSKRSEGPLFYCLFPGLVEQVFLCYKPDMSPDMAFLINCHIHLLPHPLRRHNVLKRIQAAAQGAAPAPAKKKVMVTPAASGYSKPGPKSRKMVSTVVSRDPLAKKNQKEIANLKKQVAAINPPLPAPKNKDWITDDVKAPTMPENL